MKYEIKLKSCPCCKGNASIHKRHDYLTGWNWIKIQCDDCLLQSEEINIDIEFGHPEDIEYVNNMINELVKRWNTRKPMERVVEKMEKEKKNPNLYAYAYDAYQKAIEIVEEETK